MPAGHRIAGSSVFRQNQVHPFANIFYTSGPHFRIICNDITNHADSILYNGSIKGSGAKKLVENVFD